MHIVHVAAEFAPIAKAGGLGEVVLGLSRELTRRHCQVDVIIPKYSFLQPSQLAELKLEIADFKTIERGHHVANALWSCLVEDCRVHLLEARHPAGYFHRDKIYAYPDDISRFLYFSRAVMEVLKIKKEPIDILHIHDWHTAACAVLYRELFSQFFPVRAIVLTIHNLEYQGKCAAWDLDAIGLDGRSLLTPSKLQDNDPRYPQTINLLKGGIVYADAVTTVSPSYAKEILTSALGFGLEKTLKKAKVAGILNGIDDKIWNPSLDRSLRTHFSAEDSLAKIMAAKEKNKQALEKRFPFKCAGRPLVGAVTRLVPQKGTDLIQEALRETLKLGGSFALLGSSPIPELQEQFDRLKEQYKGNPHVLLHYDYEEALAHEMYAAFNFLIAPSLFEPCGLTQLIAMRYGALPIVRATGGLKDTVFDCDDSSVPRDRRNGFIFRAPTNAAINEALQRAFDLQKNDPATYQTMVRHAMRQDFSWKHPAQEYLRLYQKLTQPAVSRQLNAEPF